jgi:hypothetical protein
MILHGKHGKAVHGSALKKSKLLSARFENSCGPQSSLRIRLNRPTMKG